MTPMTYQPGQRRRFRVARFSMFGCALAALATAALAHADETMPPVFTWQASHTTDILQADNGAEKGVRVLGLADLGVELDLDRLAGWNGATLHLRGLASHGRSANDLAGTIQGVDNIEVADNRAKLFEAYVEQGLGDGVVSLRLGFSDLNASFYSTSSSALLIGPAFGIGSELSATGPNGPSIFPSTALTFQVTAHPTAGVYAQAAVVNAESGVLGDRSGMRPLFGKGALLIGEVGKSDRRGSKVALGSWTYSISQPDLRELAPSGDPLPRRAWGVYGLLDLPMLQQGERSVSVFARAGLSDGQTTPYRGGWQAGVLVNGLFKGRPDSQLSIGANQALLTDRFTRNAHDAGLESHTSETGIELTVADKPLSWLTLQPDLQLVRTAQHGASGHTAVVAGLRIRIAAGSD